MRRLPDVRRSLSGCTLTARPASPCLPIAFPHAPRTAPARPVQAPDLLCTIALSLMAALCVAFPILHVLHRRRERTRIQVRSCSLLFVWTRQDDSCAEGKVLTHYFDTPPPCVLPCVHFPAMQRQQASKAGQTSTEGAQATGTGLARTSRADRESFWCCPPLPRAPPSMAHWCRGSWCRRRARGCDAQGRQVWVGSSADDTGRVR